MGRKVISAALIRLLQTIHVDPTDISQHPELLKYYEDLRVCCRGTTFFTPGLVDLPVACTHLHANEKLSSPAPPSSHSF
jgi:hypothetical protein